LAQSVQIIMTDDIDGSEAVETIRFSLDGKDMEIDLSEANAAELRKSLEKFVQAGRRVSGGSARGGKRSGGSTTSNREETQAIRLWAVDQGLPVNERGRISSDIVEKYKKAHAA
jgi:hypothetical protein